MTAEPEERTPAECRTATSWAQRLKRVFGIDIETCKSCGGGCSTQQGSPTRSPIGHCRQRRGNGVACRGNRRAGQCGVGEEFRGVAPVCTLLDGSAGSPEGWCRCQSGPVRRDHPLSSHQNGDLYFLYAGGA
jgi:hypothetical protein